MTNASPTVDVIVPLYNNERFVVDAVKSALGQSHGVGTVIVVDDGSVDRSASIVEDAFADDVRVRVIRASHGGLPYARNVGIRASSADVIAFLDSDDLWDPYKLSRQIRILERQPETVLVYCGFHDIDEDGRKIATRVSIRHSGNVLASLLGGNFVSGGSAALVRRSALDIAGPFDENLSYGEDWDMWLRLANLGPFACVDEDLVAIRRHGTQMSAGGGRGKRVRVLMQHLRIWSKWRSELMHNSDAQCAMFRLLASTAFRSGPGLRARFKVMRFGMARIRQLVGPEVATQISVKSPLFVLRVIATSLVARRRTMASSS